MTNYAIEKVIQLRNDIPEIVEGLLEEATEPRCPTKDCNTAIAMRLNTLLVDLANLLVRNTCNETITKQTRNETMFGKSGKAGSASVGGGKISKFDKLLRDSLRLLSEFTGKSIRLDDWVHIPKNGREGAREGNISGYKADITLTNKERNNE